MILTFNIFKHLMLTKSRETCFNKLAINKQVKSPGNNLLILVHKLMTFIIRRENAGWYVILFSNIVFKSDAEKVSKHVDIGKED